MSAEEPRDAVNHDNSAQRERRDGGMKPEREPAWKHERGEKGGKREKVVGTRRRVRARRGEEHASGRRERSWEGRKCGGENRYDCQGNSQEKKNPAGGKETEECVADKEEKEQGRKGVRGRREGEEEYRMNANREPKLSTELYPSQAEEQQSQTHFLSLWP